MMMSKLMSCSGPSTKTIVDQPKDDGHGPVDIEDQKDVNYKKIPECSACVICGSQQTNLQLKVLPCLHTICSKKCFENNENKNGNKCPCCWRLYEKDGRDFMAGDFLFELMEDELELGKGKESLDNLEVCTYCVRNEKASCWCQDCKLFLCSFCQENHPFQTTTNGHKLEDKSCGESTITFQDLHIQENKCLLHDESLTMYCKECEVLICSLEKHEEHSDEGLHNVETIQDIVLNHRKLLEEKLLEAKSIADSAEEKAQAFFDLERETLTTKRNQYFQRVKESINAISRELVSLEMNTRRNAVSESVLRSKMIRGKGFIYKGLSLRALQYHDYGNTLLQQGSQWSLFRHIYGFEVQYKEIQKEYTNLMNQVRIDDERKLSFHFDESIANEIISKIKGLFKIYYGEKQQVESIIQEEKIKNGKAVNGGAGKNLKRPIVKRPIPNNGFIRKNSAGESLPPRPVREGEGTSAVNVDHHHGIKITKSDAEAEKSFALKKRRLNNDDAIIPNPENVEKKQKSRRKQSLNLNTIKVEPEPIFVVRTEVSKADKNRSIWVKNLGKFGSKRTPNVKRSPRWPDNVDIKPQFLTAKNRVSVKYQTSSSPSISTPLTRSSNKRKTRSWSRGTR